jgi:peptidoglycan/LPS O-acetylase OafA/YrhL
MGVDIFFVLSGFLITGILVDARGAPGYFSSFYARRVLRIMPLYLAAVAALTLALPLLAKIDPRGAATFDANRWWYWAHATNLLVAWKHSWGALPFHTVPFWSLAIEEQFYLLWPAVVAWVPPKRLRTVTIGVIVGSVLLRIVLRLSGVPFLPAYTFTLTRLDGLALGALLAIVARDRDALARVAPLARAVADSHPARWAVSGVAGVAILLLLDHDGRCRSIAMQGLGIPLVELVAAVIIAAALVAPSGAPIERALSADWLRAIGRYSYGIYVVHYPVAYALQRAGFSVGRLPGAAISPLLGQVVFLLLAVLLSLFAAWLTWHVIEKHFLALKRYVPRAGFGNHHTISTIAEPSAT